MPPSNRQNDPTTHPRPRVGIIGAGMCGLYAIKACKEQGLDVVAFEMEEGCGGVWRFTEHESHSSVYKSTHINTGRDLNSVGDFPVPDGWPVSLHHEKMLLYLQMFAQQFGLLEHVKFNTAVLSLRPHDQVNGKWRWIVEHAPITGAHPNRVTNAASVSREIFDAVFVCSGHHSTPRVPEFPGMKEFAQDFGGKVVHSHAYKHNEGYRNRRVVVVGIGNSGSDITTEVSKVAKETTLISRRGVWVLANVWTVGKPRVISRLEGWAMGYCHRKIQSILGESFVAKNMKSVHSAGLTPDHRMTQAHPTLTLNNPENNLFEQLEAGKVIAKKGIKGFKGRSVKYTDGSSAEVDDVILCTGYKVGYPFLDTKVWDTTSDDNEVPLYMYMWPTNEYDTLCFMGLVQPLGSLMMIAEMQSRVAAAIIAGAIKDPRPSKEAQMADVKRRREINHEWYTPSPRHTIQVCVSEYCDELGEWIGVTPTVGRILRQKPSALPVVLMYPTTNSTYRLVGPGKWDGALAAIKKEHKAVYKNAPNRGSFLGWTESVVTLVVIVILAVLTQIMMLVTKRKFEWRPWVY